jgi:hypothetical protein
LSCFACPQAKLRDLNRAALEARMQDELQLPMASAMTGEQQQQQQAAAAGSCWRV